MSITHFNPQPKTLAFWDYYILCKLRLDVAMVLQRMEYWDSTKEAGNVHAEQTNEALVAEGKVPTQDISNWIFKAQDELQWELMGLAGEKKVASALDFLLEQGYLLRRHNPLKGFDRTLQYQLMTQTIADHVDYLGSIIKFFDASHQRMIPVFYAVEVLTKNGTGITEISVHHVLETLEKLRVDGTIPTFLHNELNRERRYIDREAISPFRNFAEWKAQNCGMHTAEMRNAKRKIAQSIPQFCGSNTSNYNTVITPITTSVITGKNLSLSGGSTRGQEKEREIEPPVFENGLKGDFKRLEAFVAELHGTSIIDEEELRLERLAYRGLLQHATNEVVEGVIEQMYYHDPGCWSKPENQGAVNGRMAKKHWAKYYPQYKKRIGQAPRQPTQEDLDDAARKQRNLENLLARNKQRIAEANGHAATYQ